MCMGLYGVCQRIDRQYCRWNVTVDVISLGCKTNNGKWCLAVYQIEKRLHIASHHSTSPPRWAQSRTNPPLSQIPPRLPEGSALCSQTYKQTNKQTNKTYKQANNISKQTNKQTNKHIASHHSSNPPLSKTFPRLPHRGPHSAARHVNKQNIKTNK